MTLNGNKNWIYLVYAYTSEDGLLFVHLTNIYRIHALCQVMYARFFSSKNIEKYHWGIYHLIESNRLYSLLQDDKYSTKKKGRKGEQGG